MSDALLRYYHEELRYLRQQGEHFAEAHPKVAGHLRLGHGAIEDPFVGRLLEGFAFLNARMRLKLDQQIGTLTEALLNQLYPHYLLPTPALSIIQMQAHEQLDKSHTIAAGSRLTSTTPQGETCYFNSTYPVTLWPVKIDRINLRREPSIKLNQPGKSVKSYLTVQLSCTKSELQFNKLKPDTLRFYINIATPHAYQLYDLLFNQVETIMLSHPNSYGQYVTLDKTAIKAVGFAENEGLLPYPAHSFTGYRLLTEYYAMPEKFLFFELQGLSPLLERGFTNELQIHFLLKQATPELEPLIDQHSLLLNCTPMVNIFTQTSEPINLNHTQYEYHLIPDAHQKKESIEIYSINNMRVLGQSDVQCLPYFGHKYATAKDTQYLYWHATRKPAWELGAAHIDGDEIFLSFSEPSDKLPQDCILSADLLCTNRDLPIQLPFGGDSPAIQFWQANSLVRKIRCLMPITAPKYRNRDKLRDTDLISHIALSQISFSHAQGTLNTLKEVLALYQVDDDPQSQDAIQKGLCEAKISHCTERHPSSLKYGFCQGMDLHLEIDEKFFTQHIAFLFGSVLAEFFAKSCSINSFTRLTLSSKQRGVIHRWPPKFGHKATL